MDWSDIMDDGESTPDSGAAQFGNDEAGVRLGTKVLIS